MDRNDQLELLRCGEVTIEGRMPWSSNATFLVDVVDGERSAQGIYKPLRGERPLWDFEPGLHRREVAAYHLSVAMGIDLVPPTVLRDGPLGPGSVQLWIGDPYAPLADDLVVDLVPEGRTPPGWHEVLDGETPSGSSVTVVHSGADDVRSLAVLDAALNNSDRKGSHCLRDASGRLWAIDHGVSLSAEPKLRTVLWGWAGEPLPAVELDRLEMLSDALATSGGLERLGALLPEHDVAALIGRVHRLLRTGIHPHPSPGWPAVPWPPL